MRLINPPFLHSLLFAILASMKKNYVLLIGVGIIIFGGAVFFWKDFKQADQANKQIKHSPALPKEVTITLDKNGFSPKTVTIKVGGAIRWKNMSGDKQTVNSDDYPNNQLHRELNFGVFNNESTVVYTFTKSGTYGYHNQFKPEQKGEIIVTK